MNCIQFIRGLLVKWTASRELFLSGWKLLLILGLSTAPFMAIDNSVAADVSKELQVKCSYLHNFTKFVEWPVGSFAAENSALIIGVCGSDTLRGELEAQVKERSLGKRHFQITRIEKPEDIAGVHLVYIADAPDSLCSQLIAAATSSAALTIGETEEFVRSGGVIRFVLEEGKVRFEINQGSAEAARLKLSPQLLKLARVVRRK
jgi:hypothetical protein